MDFDDLTQFQKLWLLTSVIYCESLDLNGYVRLSLCKLIYRLWDLSKI